MDYDVLKAEITDDPLGLSYVGMSDQQVADSLNTVAREQDRTSMTGSEILNQVNAANWASLTDVQRQTVWNIVYLGDVNPFGVEATMMTDVFGSASATITALKAARKIAVSRATELELPFIDIGNVASARSL